MEWRCRRWRRLLNIIDQLPRNSRYVEAMTQDEDLAAEMLDHPPKDTPAGKPTRRMADWSPSVELLTAILNRLAELAQAVAALGGAKPRKITPAPIPTTVLDKLRDRRRVAAHRALAARILSPDDRDT